MKKKHILAALLALTLTAVSVPAFELPEDNDGQYETPAEEALFEGKGNALSPYLIGCAADLVRLSDAVNGGKSAPDGTPYGAAYYRLCGGADMKNIAFTPIGTASHPFTGCFDGGFFTVENLTVNGGFAYAGLFGYVKNGTIRSIRLVGASVSVVTSGSEETSAGLLCGKLACTDKTKTAGVYDCMVGGTVTAADKTAKKLYAGGVCGALESKTAGYTAKIEGAAAEVSVTASGNKNVCVGGIVGYAGILTVRVRCVTASGSVHASASAADGAYSGGIIGSLTAPGSWTPWMASGNGLSEALADCDVTIDAAGNTSKNSGNICGFVSGVDQDKPENCCATRKSTNRNKESHFDGTYKAASDAKKTAFYRDTLGFDTNVFYLADGSLPMLRTKAAAAVRVEEDGVTVTVRAGGTATDGNCMLSLYDLSDGVRRLTGLYEKAFTADGFADTRIFFPLEALPEGTDMVKAILLDGDAFGLCGIGGTAEIQ